MNPDRQKVYHVYFIGDPEGADVSVSYFPSLPTDAANQPNGGQNGK